MCGITGYYAKEAPTGEVFARMRESLHHRGPDDSGSFIAERAGLANLRLSIIDVEGGHQPFVSDDGQIAVVQNGEIYNHIELAAELKNTRFECRTRSDTEVLLRLYERDGIDFLSRLNGMFAIAVYDRRDDSLYLARDRLGVKPLFWYAGTDSMIFGSEIKAILAAGIDRQVNLEALNLFLTLNYVPPPTTMFRNIRHVMPGCYLRISGKSVKERPWWKLADSMAADGSQDPDIEEFRYLLSDSVRLRMRSDVPFGAFLSGGVDSSAVVATMAGESRHPPRTFCIGFDDPRFDESQYAETLAGRVGAEHTTSIVKQNMLDLWPAVTFFNDQPHGDVSFMPTYRVSELAVKHVKVVLTGDGGDELFAGYDKYRDFFAACPDAMGDRSQFIQNYSPALRLFSREIQSALYAGDLRKQPDCSVRGLLDNLLTPICSNDGVNLALYVDSIWLLPGNNLVKPDRMGMANSLEARTPFLDYRIVEWAFGLAGNQKLNNGVTKVILKNAVQDLIGRDLAFRKKQMFTVPIGEWLKNRASSLANNVLLDSRTIDRGLFDIRELRRLINDHMQGSANYTRELRALIALELWFRVFVDEKSLQVPSWKSLGFSSSLAA